MPIFPMRTRPPRGDDVRRPRPPDGLTAIRPEGGRVNGLPFALLVAGYPWWVTAFAGRLNQSPAIVPYVVVEPEAIAREVGISGRRGRKALVRLQEGGWISVNAWRDGRSTRTVFWLRWRLPAHFWGGGEP